jgi:hypothetical protein
MGVIVWSIRVIPKRFTAVTIGKGIHIGGSSSGWAGRRDYGKSALFVHCVGYGKFVDANTPVLYEYQDNGTSQHKP